MSFLTLIFALAVPWAVGFIICSALLRNEEYGVLERLFFGFGAGTALLTWLMFIIGLLKIPYGVFVITLFVAAVGAPFLYYLYQRGRSGLWRGGRARTMSSAEGSKAPVRGLKFYVAIILVLWLILKLGFVFYESATRPIFSWDAWVHWSTGAKLFYYNKGLLLDLSDENFFGLGYRFPGHPLLMPLLEVWTALWLGKFHEVFVKTWSSFYYLSLLAIFFYAVKRETAWFYALVAVFFLSTVPILTYHGTDAYSDLPLGYYTLASVLCFYRYVKAGRKGTLALSAFFLAAGVLTKNEGVFFLAAVAAVLFFFAVFVKRRGLTDLLWFIIPPVVLLAPWMVFKYVNGFGFGHDDMSESGFTWLSDPTYMSKSAREVHWEIIPVLMKEIFLGVNLTLIFPLWVFVTVFYIRTVITTELKYLYSVLLLVIAAYIFIYLTIEVTAVTESSGMNRNALTYLPIIYLTTALLVSRVMPLSGSDPP